MKIVSTDFLCRIRFWADIADALPSEGELTYSRSKFDPRAGNAYRVPTNVTVTGNTSGLVKLITITVNADPTSTNDAEGASLDQPE